MRIFSRELPDIEVTVTSQYSPELAKALMRGKVDAAFMRPEPDMPDLAYKLVTREPLVVMLPSDHRFAARKTVDPRDLAGETFVNVSSTAPALRVVIDDYIARQKLDLRPDHEADNISMAISLIASTRGVALLPAYVQNFLPWSVISRPIDGEAPVIDLVIGYHTANASPLLKLFLSRIDGLVQRVALRPA
jgi:LysR family hca operon transcriptional activator